MHCDSFTSTLTSGGPRIVLWHISWEPELRSWPLLWNGFVNTPVARQWLSSGHMVAATDTHATREELLEAVFCAVRAGSRLSIPEGGI
jgi:hypothetical protein